MMTSEESVLFGRLLASLETLTIHPNRGYLMSNDQVNAYKALVDKCKKYVDNMKSES